MNTVTIPQKLTQGDELVVIPQRDYEEFLALKKIIPIVKPYIYELRVFERGRKQIKEGRYISWSKLKNELANSCNRTSKKTA